MFGLGNPAATSLAQLSDSRIDPELLAIQQQWDPAAPLPVRLRQGRDAALAALRVYVPSIHLELADAEEQMREIDAWASRNQEPLRAAMASTASDLPEQLRLEMGSERAQQFFLVSYAQAAAGLGPWESGAVARAVSDPDNASVTDAWARRDAVSRLRLFALIVKLHNDGTLGKIFVAPPTAASGLGALPFWLVIVSLVIFAAALVAGIVLWRRIDVNNRLMRDLCEKARQDGDTETVRLCVEATRDLQQVVPGGGGSTLSAVLWAAGGAAAAWFALKLGAPALERYRRRQR